MKYLGWGFNMMLTEKCEQLGKEFESVLEEIWHDQSEVNYILWNRDDTGTIPDFLNFTVAALTRW